MNRITSFFAKKNLWNPALDQITQMPKSDVTIALLTAISKLTKNLYSEANTHARALGVKDHMFAECVLDLELLGGFDKVLLFTGDKALASTYIDAIVFMATNKNPSELPTELEFRSLGTEHYRGIAKYAMAGTYFNVSNPVAWLFGKEYSKIKTGNANDFAYVAPIGPSALTIQRTGAIIVEYALTGRVPSREENDAFSEVLKLEQEALQKLVDSMKDT
jgi:hypothetical protein